MRISDWSSDVCSSDLDALEADQQRQPFVGEGGNGRDRQREGDRHADGHAEPEQPEQQQQSHRRYSSPRTGGSASGRGGGSPSVKRLAALWPQNSSTRQPQTTTGRVRRPQGRSRIGIFVDPAKRGETKGVGEGTR